MHVTEVPVPPLTADPPSPEAAPALGGGGGDDDRPLHRWWRRLGALNPWEQAAVVIDAVVIVAATVFTLVQLEPGLLVADTTPAGGDMGAHVWGPAFLRDELLPRGRLAG